MPRSKPLLNSLIALISAAAIGGGVFAAFEQFGPRAKPSGRIAEASVTLNDGPGGFDHFEGLITERSAIENTSISMGMTSAELLEKLSVERADGSNAKIALYDLDEPGKAPLILDALIEEAQKTEPDSRFTVISYCDMEKGMWFIPYKNATMAGSAAAIVTFALLLAVISAAGSKSSERIRSGSEKSSSAPAETVPTVLADYSYQRIVGIASADIGKVKSSAPKGVTASGHLDAAKALLGIGHSLGINGAFIIAMGPISSERQAASASAKACSYIACAVSELGKRCAVIECDLAHPLINTIFRKPVKGSISDIALGRCTIMDAAVIDARKGVDIYPQSVPCTEPDGILSSDAFKGLLEFLSGQYDLILLNAPCLDRHTAALLSPLVHGTAAAVSDRFAPEDEAAEVFSQLNNNILCTIVTERNDNK